MKALIIEKQAVRRNAAVIKTRAGSAVIYAALTGNAHGAGLVEMAKLLREDGIVHFAVSETEQAEALRKAGFVDEEILMLRATTDRDALEKLIDLSVVCTISSHDTGAALNSLAEARATVVEAHIQIDSGMGYGGFLMGEPDKVLSMYRYLPNVALTGIYTQMHTKSNKKRDVSAQLEAFQQVVETIQAAGFETGRVHAASSTALMSHDFARLDAVRVGSAFLGRCHRTMGDGLAKVGYGQAAIEDVRWLPKGHTVGNQRLMTLKRPTRVGLLPVGYQNGFGVGREKPATLGAWLRGRFSRGTYVRIGDQRAPVLGQIGAMDTLVDITNVKCGSGDLAVFELDPLYAQELPRIYR